MEKLLNLLNEYQPLESKNQEYCIEGTELYIKTKVYAEADDYLNYTPWVISKKFGFIQWLAENDKIKDPLPQVLKDIDVVGNDTITGVDVYSTTDSLLMLLAIQDDPISFLISILK